MKRLIIVLSLLVVVFSLYAEKMPKAVSNSRKAVVSILAYKNGVLLRSGTGTFVGSNGEILTSYSLFLDADSVVAIDAAGKERNVLRLLGANEIYDCIKVSVGFDKKIKTLTVSDAGYKDGDKLFLVCYGIKNAGAIESLPVNDIDKTSGCAYYTFDKAMQENWLSAPVVNEKGELVAIVQPSDVGNQSKSYALAASFVDALEITPVNFNSYELRRINLPKALPKKKEDALTCLHLQKIVSDNAYYTLLDDYVAAFPDSYEGYQLLAEKRFLNGNYADADKAWEDAIKLSDKPDDVYYNKANVFSSAIYNEALDSASRSRFIASALECYDNALGINDQPLYRLQKGNLLFKLSRYADAFDCYSSLSATNMRNAETFSLAAACKSYLGEYDAAIAQLDSAVAYYGSLPVSELLPYVARRASVKMAAERYKEALLDFEFIINNANFTPDSNIYFMRACAAYGAKVFSVALESIDKAIELVPDKLEYLIEKGRICYRVSMIDDALSVLNVALSIAPESPDVNYILGRCYMIEGDNTSAKSFLLKAKETGHPDAEEMLKRLQ